MTPSELRDIYPAGTRLVLDASPAERNCRNRPRC